MPTIFMGASPSPAVSKARARIGCRARHRTHGCRTAASSKKHGIRSLDAATPVDNRLT
jgi:hypothetical protein